jgi:bifunctional DNase/RNase
MKEMDLVNIGIESSTGAPLVVLRELDEPHRLLPVFVGGFEASSIAIALGESPPPRPLTHDLMVTLVERLDAAVDRVEIGGFDDETFLAEVVLLGPNGEQRVDARPSDAIAMAVRVDAAVFVSEDVLERAGAEPATKLVDPEVIDQEVEEFREFLSGVEPTDFADLALPPADESDASERSASTFEVDVDADVDVDEAEPLEDGCEDSDRTEAASNESTSDEVDSPEMGSGERDAPSD